MRCTLTILFLSVIFSLMGQQDTLMLETVEVSATRLLKYAHGTKVDIVNISSFTKNLDKEITGKSGIYFKEYGNGQLSTIAFRGTSAAHTNVIWNGNNLNSPTLGLTDFAIIPSYMLESVVVQYGSSSALYGSGALGGAISINQSDPDFYPHRRLNALIEQGSFGKLSYGASAGFGNHKLTTSTKFYSQELTNDFEFNFDDQKFTQTNAAVSQRALSQNFSYLINKSSWISMTGMYIHNEREIQPTISNLTSDDELSDRNFYFSTRYHNESGPGLLTVNAGYTSYNQRYNNNPATNSYQLTLSPEYDIVLRPKTSIRAGVKAMRFGAENSSSLQDIGENQIDIYASINHDLKSWWKLSLNLRQSFYSNQNAPFAPSLGNEFTVFNRQDEKIKFRTSFSRSYRIPTLNDRYWNPGGNPDLKSEESLNFELGVNYRLERTNSIFHVDLTHYRTWSDNWIVWLPGENNIWVPNNLRDVHIQGIEFSTLYKLSIGAYALNLKGQYNYTKSTNQKGLSPTDNTGKGAQLPYVPIHGVSLSKEILYKTWSMTTHIDMDSRRFASLDNTRFNSVDGYILLNATFNKNWSIGSDSQLSAYFRINNLTNSDYQNFKNYAMPGRNYSIGININL